MYPEPTLQATPINITPQGMAVPPNATIRVTINGGAMFNSAINCRLVFDRKKGCPFQNAVGHNLSLQIGDNLEPLKPGVPPGTYPFSIRSAVGPGTDPFDFVITP